MSADRLAPVLGVLVATLGCDQGAQELPVLLYAPHADDCAASPNVVEAAAWWADLGAPLVPTGTCTVADFDTDIEGRAELALHENELPVFVVDSIADDDGTDLDGLGLWAGCTQGVAVVDPSPFVLAHEIGHARGLGHDDRPGNVMSIERVPLGVAWIDDDQIEAAE